MKEDRPRRYEIPEACPFREKKKSERASGLKDKPKDVKCEIKKQPVFERLNASLFIEKGDKIMATINNKLIENIESLSDIEKPELVDSILMQLDKPDPEIDRIWAEEARKRWQAYKSGKLETVSYKQVMEKYRAR
jgi:hypothetical protein